MNGLAKPELDAEEAADVEAARVAMQAVIGRHLPADGMATTPVPGLTLHRRSVPMPPGAFLYRPAFAFIVRGVKRVVVGEDAYQYDEGHYLVTAIDLPTVVQVCDAGPSSPYISIKLDLDLELAREVMAELDLLRGGASGGPGISVGPVGRDLADATRRLVDLVERPLDIAILARAVHREILYRLLTGPVGGRLREAVVLGTQAQRVSLAIRWIREHYSEPLPIGQLAEIAGMGVSTLHHHFLALTAMSPLQYQKHLRLHEARRLMLADHLDAGSAAIAVGYESPSQFNREYRRLFGAPPKRDVRALLGAV